MSEKRQHTQMGESQITINKKVVAVVVLVVVTFVGAVGWMYQLTAMARPPTIESGGYHK